MASLLAGVDVSEQGNDCVDALPVGFVEAVGHVHG